MTTRKSASEDKFMGLMTIIPVEGKVRGIPRDREPPLEELQGLVGGLIEYVTLPDGAVAVVNEEGRPLGLPSNPRAGLRARRILLGTVVILEGDARLEEEEEVDPEDIYGSASMRQSIEEDRK